MRRCSGEQGVFIPEQDETFDLNDDSHDLARLTLRGTCLWISKCC